MMQIRPRSVGRGEEIVLPSTEALVETLAEQIADELCQAIDERGQASLVVSGGRTPAALFERLSQIELPWQNVWVTLADERWVAPTDDASNEKLVRRVLLQNQAAKAQFIPMKNSALTPEAGARQCSDELARIPEPFDVLILGMGDDGHTASLFPCSAELVAGLAPDAPRCLAVNPTTAPHGRMSYSLAALKQSRHTILLITGDAKWQVYQKALQSGSVEAIRQMPIRAFLHSSEVLVDVYWAA